MSHVLDSDVLEFIHDCVDSVELVEVLVLLAAGAKTVSDVSQHLKTTEHSATMRLQHLCACGVAQVSDGLYRYAPESDALAARSQKFLRAYGTHRVRVIDAIFNCAKH